MTEERSTATGVVRVAIEPEVHRRPLITAAVVAAGGSVCELERAEVLVWTAWNDPDGLTATLRRAPQVRWVQLSTAGIDAIAPALDERHVWTCAKGAFSAPIAEHALGLMLAGRRNLHRYVGASTYSTPSGSSLLGARITIVGGGGIAGSLIDLLRPFGVDVTVVRRTVAPMGGVARVVGPGDLDEAIAAAAAVVLAVALTPETDRLIGERQLAVMGPGCWLVNVARGRLVDTDALVEALRTGTIGGAALDAHDQEPLPDGHPLWSAPNCIITPHTACTPEMGDGRFAERVRENVVRWRTGVPLLGRIDSTVGY